MVDIQSPLVSVVTVVRNGLPFVRDTIASVLKQDYPALEYWIIDGGSTDGTVDAIRDVESRLAGWISERDGGIADAFNKGLSRARGDYVMFLNADDALAGPHSITALIEAARERSWPDVVYGDCDVVDRDSGAILYRAAIEYDRSRFLRFAVIPHPSMIVHRRYFDRHGEFDRSYKMAMDYELLLRGVPDVGAVRVPNLVTRVRAGGASTQDPRSVVEENIRALRKNGYLTSVAEAAFVRLYYRCRFAVRDLAEWVGLYHRPGAQRRSAS